MKLFNQFTYKEVKEICKTLDKHGVYYRHPKKAFYRVLGNDTVYKLILMGWLVDSPNMGAWDFRDPCFGFSPFFKKLFNFIVNPFWCWFKIYVLHIYTFKRMWQKFRIKCGHHYDWQDYEGWGLEDI